MAGGQLLTAAQGNFGRALTVALVGMTVDVVTGAITPNNSGTVPLTGQSISSQQGTVILPYDRALTGSAITSAQGTISTNLRPTNISGQAIASAAGFLQAAGNSLTIPLSGAEAEFFQGIIVIGPQLITGMSSTIAAGTMTTSRVVPLIGTAVAVQAGTVAASQDADDTFIVSSMGSMAPAGSIALLGQAIVTAQGTLTITGDVTLPLTGIAASGLQGSVGFERSFLLTGQEIAGFQYFVGAPGFASLTGQEITAIAGDVFTTNDRSFALTGQQFTASTGITFASSLAFPPGLQINSQQQGIGPRNAALVGSLIAASPGYLGVVGADIIDRPSGGYTRRKRRPMYAMTEEEFYASLPIPAEVEYEKEKLAELPKRAQLAVKRTVEKAIDVSDPKAAAILAGSYLHEKQQERMEDRARQSFKDEHARWNDAALPIIQALILDGLRRKADRETLVRVMEEQRIEDEEISRILDLWVNL